MNILFYTPFNLRSRDTESLMQAFINKGHSVFLLTQTEPGVYHRECEKIGAKVFSHSIIKTNVLAYYLKHTINLITFCRKNKIDFVYSHLETASLPAVIAQYFIKAKVFACRHIIDEAYLFNNRNFILLNKIVYKLAKQVIVVSNHSKRFMVENEQVDDKKIRVINLAYNFSLYEKPDQSNVAVIRGEYNTKMLLLTACRLVEPKRPHYSLAVLKNLVASGCDVKLLLLGSGPKMEELQSFIVKENLQNHAFVLGFRSNIVDYISACDLIVHPSILDSSSVIIKEAGLLSKPVIACEHVGDVDEYLVSENNSFLVSQENCINEMSQLLTEIYNEKFDLNTIGKNLNTSVLQRFSIDKIIGEYDRIHNTIN